MSKTNYIFEAKALAELGISVIPVKQDGSKLPSIKWKEFQSRIMSDEEIEKHFKDCGGAIALTGNISNLLCIDFDLDKQRLTDDFWKAFNKDIPDHMKERMLINNTRSGGFHIWLRTDYQDKSRKIAHRPLTIPELSSRYEKMIKEGANEDVATRMLLNKPLECVIETRSRGSYGVFAHEQYSRFYGKSINWFTKEEVEFLLSCAYNLDYGYRRPTVYKGGVKSYEIIYKFNGDATPQGLVNILENSGLFKFYDRDFKGDYRLSRVGSGNPYSAKVFNETPCTFYAYGMNPLADGDKNTLTPFEVYCAVNGYEEQEAVEALEKYYN